MPPRIPQIQCLRALNAHAPRSNGCSMTLPFRPFSASTPSQASTPKRGRKFRDPYAVTQARARRAANVSRQEVLQQERTQALGDPVRGQATAFVESFDIGRPSRDDKSNLNHFIRPDDIISQLEVSKRMTVPVPAEARRDGPGAEEARAREDAESKARHEEQHKIVQAALERIVDLENGSSKDRLRSNIQRCIQHFGRHETDKILPPKPKATPILSFKTFNKSATLESDRADRPEAQRKGVDTGSSEVQIAILTAKIRSLANHLDSRGRKDKVGKRDLRLLVHRRQKLLQYLRRKERGGPRWQRCIETLGLTEGTWQGEISL